MKHIYNYSKKEKVKLTIDAINKANIFDVKIPDMKVSNRVLTKVCDNNDVWLKLDDIKEYDKNPKKISNKLKKLEEGYVYDIKENTFDTTFRFTDYEFKDTFDALLVARDIRDYIVKKIENLDDGYVYRVMPFYEYGVKETDVRYNDDGTISNEFDMGNGKHTIGFALCIEKKDEKTLTRYFGISSTIEINVKRENNAVINDKLSVIVDGKLNIIINVSI